MQRQGEAGLQINQPPCRTRCFQRPLKNWCNPSRTGGLTITIFPSLISLTNLVSLPSHFCTCTNLSPSMEKVDYEQKKKNFFFYFLFRTSRRKSSMITPSSFTHLTLTCRSSGVVSSNSSPILAESSVFLKVLWVFTTTLSPSWLITTVGLVTLPTCLVAKPTPVKKKFKSLNKVKV